MLLQLRLTLENKDLPQNHAGHAQGKKLFDTRLELLQKATRTKTFKLEHDKRVELQTRSTQRREMEVIAATVPDADKKNFTQLDAMGSSEAADADE